MRPIDANDLKGRLMDSYDPYHECGTVIEIDVVTDMIDEAPTINEWISVKERLPEEDGEYLAGWYGSDEVVLARFTNDCFGMRFGLCNPEKEHRPTFYYIDDEWGEVEWEDIECWMQKPVPPEVEG